MNNYLLNVLYRNIQMKMTADGFAIIRLKFGSLSQEAVDNINLIVETCEKYNLSYPQTAYLLATTYHETGGTMKPIKEYGGWKYLSKYDTGRLAKTLGNTPQADGDGQKYAGKGYTMITGYYNYKFAGEQLGIDLINNPDLALEPKYAAEILVKGSANGWFTSKKLSDYINDKSKNYYQARRVINSLDKAQLIASYAVVFEKALRSY